MQGHVNTRPCAFSNAHPDGQLDKKLGCKKSFLNDFLSQGHHLRSCKHPSLCTLKGGGAQGGACPPLFPPNYFKSPLNWPKNPRTPCAPSFFKSWIRPCSCTRNWVQTRKKCVQYRMAKCYGILPILPKFEID